MVYDAPDPLNPTSSPPAESERALERPERSVGQAVPLGPQVHLHQVPPVLQRPGEWVEVARGLIVGEHYQHYFLNFFISEHISHST